MNTIYHILFYDYRESCVCYNYNKHINYCPHPNHPVPPKTRYICMNWRSDKTITLREKIHSKAKAYFGEYYWKCKDIYWSRDLGIWDLSIKPLPPTHPYYSGDIPIVGVWIIADNDLQDNPEYYLEDINGYGILARQALNMN